MIELLKEYFNVKKYRIIGSIDKITILEVLEEYTFQSIQGARIKERQYIVMISGGKVIFSGLIRKGAGRKDVIPDYFKTYYLNKLTDLTQQIASKVKSKKFKERTYLIFEKDVDIYFYISKGVYHLQYRKKDGKLNNLLQTSNDLVGRLMEELADVRNLVFITNKL